MRRWLRTALLSVAAVPVGLLIGAYLVDDPFTSFTRYETSELIVEIPAAERGALAERVDLVERAILEAERRSGLLYMGTRLHVRFAPIATTFVHPFSRGGEFRRPLPVPFGSYRDPLIVIESRQGDAALWGNLLHEITHALVYEHLGSPYRALNEGFAAWATGDGRVPRTPSRIRHTCAEASGIDYGAMHPDIYGPSAVPFALVEVTQGRDAVAPYLLAIGRRGWDRASWTALVGESCRALEAVAGSEP